MPDIHIRGPVAPGLNAVVIFGRPNDAELKQARATAAQNHRGDPLLYVVADSPATLVLLSTLWQLGTTPPDVKLRGPEARTPVVIYGIPGEPAIEQLRAEASNRWAGSNIAYLVAETAEQVVFLQWQWQEGLAPP